MNNLSECSEGGSFDSRIDKHRSVVLWRINLMIVAISLLIQGCVVTQRKQQRRITFKLNIENRRNIGREIPTIYMRPSDESSIDRKIREIISGAKSNDKCHMEVEKVFKQHLQELNNREIRTIILEIEILRDEYYASSSEEHREILSDRIEGLMHKLHLANNKISVRNPGF